MTGRALLVTVILTAGIPALLNPGVPSSLGETAHAHASLCLTSCAALCLLMQAHRLPRRSLTGMQRVGGRDNHMIEHPGAVLVPKLILES